MFRDLQWIHPFMFLSWSVFMDKKLESSFVNNDFLFFEDDLIGDFCDYFIINTYENQFLFTSLTTNEVEKKMLLEKFKDYQ